MPRLRGLVIGLAVAAANAQSHFEDDAVALFQHAKLRPAPEPVFEPGQSVHIRVSDGNLSGTLVPAVVKSRKPNMRYHIRMMTTPLSKDLCNIPAAILSKPEPSDGVGLQLMRQQAEVTARAAVQIEKEANARTRSEGTARKLNATELSRWMNSLRNNMEKEIVVEARDKGCPKVTSANRAYKLIAGSGRIIDNFANDTKDTALACGDSCDARNGCKAFQWSPTKKLCILSKAGEPHLTKEFKDYMFCGQVEKP